MSKQVIKTIITIAIIVLCVGGIKLYKYYQYNYVELVTDYYEVTYTPPLEKDNYYGALQYSDPKFNIKKLGAYSSDSTALAERIRAYKEHHDFYLETYYKSSAKHPKTEADRMYQQTEMKAALNLLNENEESLVTLVSFTHHRSYKTENILPLIKKYGMDFKKIIDYCNKNDLRASYYQVN